MAILVVHGIGGSFYYSVYIEMGRELASRGYTLVTGNNRGHHFGWGPAQFANGESRLQGAGWERFSESRYDVAAWVDHVAGLGFDRIVLFGHSYGAFKSVYYQGERQDPRIAGIILCSAPVGVPRLAQPQMIPLIESMVAQGRGRDLLPWDLIPWSGGTLSADAALDVMKADIDVFGVLSDKPPLSQSLPDPGAFRHKRAERRRARRTGTHKEKRHVQPKSRLHAHRRRRAQLPWLREGTGRHYGKLGRDSTGGLMNSGLM